MKRGGREDGRKGGMGRIDDRVGKIERVTRRTAVVRDIGGGNECVWIFSAAPTLSLSLSLSHALSSFSSENLSDHVVSSTVQ